ncbi:UvrD-helicase domain-containing protein [Bradyrhizobium sp. HKCCYLS2033]|uniref:UvrD-helicase domain-containing protein n=1 Tax=Bradyrhizobium sp. HKCCYLS2033 TaxID=3420739 RepID=UPI003EBE4539
MTAIRISAITDDDIAWACDALGLASAAFSGSDGKDTRQDVLKSLSELDVEACPGSGKTTLLVGKLAILARSWNERSRGICVLSHTNVARGEIERRLGNTTVGQRLLRYPHFVGTIHGFVNEFLALPWLRSRNFPVRLIDDDIVLARRWGKLKYSTRAYLDKKGLSQAVLKLKSLDLDLGDLSFGRHTDTYKALQEACRQSVVEGFFCYDEMFLVAHDLLETYPETRDIIRYRFPLLFMDEVQDNSEMQSSLLYLLFSEGGGKVVRQRYGDSNQAIYRDHREAGACTDTFPNELVRKDIPDSHRFGEQIAQFAKPLGVVPQNLVGRGPSSDIPRIAADKHAIFLFDDANINGVMPSYSGYLREIFSVESLKKGVFTAVGAVHRPSKDDHLPRHVGNYWGDYDSELVGAEPKPRYYCQYVMSGLKRSNEQGESYHLTEFIAEGVLALVRKSNPLCGLVGRQRKHQYLLELLAGNPEVLNSYFQLVTAFAVDRVVPTVEQWKSEWADRIRQIAETIAGSKIDDTLIAEFLKWDSATPTELRRTDNKFRDQSFNPVVEIRMGSIHSVKGETHTATLVCETYHRAHHLETLKSWLLGSRSGGRGQSEATKSRLRQHYVAVTRPSHLLCLAMRESTFSADEVEKLKLRGWRVGRVVNGAPEWM